MTTGSTTRHRIDNEATEVVDSFCLLETTKGTNG